MTTQTGRDHDDTQGCTFRDQNIAVEPGCFWEGDLQGGRVLTVDELA